MPCPPAQVDLSFIKYVSTDADFEIERAKPGLILADVYSKAFGPCSAMDSLLYNLYFDITDAGKQFGVIRAQSDHIKALQSQLKCTPQSRFVLYKDGSKIEEVDGPQLPIITGLVNQHASVGA